MKPTTTTRTDRERLAAIRALRSLAMEMKRRPHGKSKRPRWWCPQRGA